MADTTSSNANREWQDLPNELQYAVASLLDCETIFALRLVSHHAKEIADREFGQIFRHVVIHPASWSLIRLKAMVRNPEIAKSVRCMTVIRSKGIRYREVEDYERSDEDIFRKHWPVCNQLTTDESNYLKEGGLMRDLVECIKACPNLDGLAFDFISFSEVTKKCGKQMFLDDDEEQPAADLLMSYRGLLGLGARAFMRQQLSGETFTKVSEDRDLTQNRVGKFPIKNELAHIFFEAHFNPMCDWNYQKRDALVLQAFHQAGRDLQTYREWSFDQSIWMQAAPEDHSPTLLCDIPLQPATYALKKLHMWIDPAPGGGPPGEINYDNMLPCLQHMPGLTHLCLQARFQGRFIRPSAVEKFWTDLWLSDAVPKLESLAIICAVLFTNPNDEELLFSQFLKQRSATLKEVFLACQSAEYMVPEFLRCVRDDLQLTNLYLHYCTMMDEWEITEWDEWNKALKFYIRAPYDRVAQEFSDDEKEPVIEFWSNAMVTLETEGNVKDAVVKFLDKKSKGLEYAFEDLDLLDPH